MTKTHEIKQRLQELADANDGRLTPDMVVEDAKNENSPLHDEFEWNIKKAAAAHWLARARFLISSVSVVIRVSNVDVRAPYYVRDPSRASDQQGYVSVDRLRSDADAARDALIQEFNRAGDLLRRARILAVALKMDADVAEIISEVDELRARVEAEAPASVM